MVIAIRTDRYWVFFKSFNISLYTIPVDVIYDSLNCFDILNSLTSFVKNLAKFGFFFFI